MRVIIILISRVLFTSQLLLPMRVKQALLFLKRFLRNFQRLILRMSQMIAQDFCTLIQANSVNRLLKTSIRLMLIFWPLYRNHSINLLLQKHLVPQHGNSFRHGIRYQRMIVCYPRICNESLQNE